MGPLIREPLSDLQTGLETLEPGTGKSARGASWVAESWALQPNCDAINPKLWHPGVKWGVQRGSFSHQTEFFGPLLSVMRADSLEDAIEIVNDTAYGLTSGLESLDPR